MFAALLANTALIFVEPIKSLCSQPCLVATTNIWNELPDDVVLAQSVIGIYCPWGSTDGTI